ncbi:uncharacterized protein PAC_06794 [Phialocephala subalpina]|uniref:Protein kinase domain-containing protein n=1 Tax=Phialocephala subalpina TaxID=576137 RepID=A0A1L7WVV6_9HELO|nr:uncharacterized protein PAC_06794 [Phialocephala subalpina]
MRGNWGEDKKFRPESYREVEPLSRHSKPRYNPRLEVLPDPMASVMMSTYEALPEVRRKQHVGTFEPSTELLDKLRGLLVSSPPTSRRSSSAMTYLQLPFQPDQRRPSIKREDSSLELFYPTTSSTAQKESHPQKQTPTSSNPSSVSSISIAPESRIKISVLRTCSLLSMAYSRLLIFNVLVILVKEGRAGISSSEADSYFKQSILGLEYLHRSGVAHQDIRPENLLITINGVLKIANFQRASYFSQGGKSGVIARRKNSSISSDYVAPEVFVRTEYDPRPVDMWAIGLVYMEMRRGKLLWSVAAEGADENYDRYLQDRVGMWGYRPIENLNDEHCRRVISSLLDPVPERRYSASRVLKSTWCNRESHIGPELG